MNKRNFQPINPPLNEGTSLPCARCGKMTSDPVADMSGPAFAAYYCPECRLAAQIEDAAPDLLAALEAACLFAEKEATRLSIECGMGASEWESFVPPWFSPARAAIAKARGQE